MTVPAESLHPAQKETKLDAQVDLDAYDEEQVRLMEERCILVDENDVAYGEGSKKQCECSSSRKKNV